MAASAKQERSRLGRNEAIWGYLFIAAPLIGFLIFAAGPLIISLFLSFTNYDLFTSPRWAGLSNWQQALSLTLAEVPQRLDEETGERIFRCGRTDVPASQVPELEGTYDERLRQEITCSPLYGRPRESLPSGYSPWFEFMISERSYVVGATDPILWQGMFNTVFLMLGIPISLAISLGLAMALNQGIYFTNFFRLIYYMPTILPIAATALIWLWIFNPDFGLLNYALGTRINWLQNADMVKPSLIIMGIWGGLGYQMLIYLAGLQGVPRQLYEAAEIDGANTWQKFRFVTWPSLTPTTFFLLITSMIGGFQNFVQPFIMTQGGPGRASTTVVMSIYDNAFRDLQMGYASTQAWLLGAIIMLITVINFSLARRWVFYETDTAS